jgi:hypothetical protein
MPANTLRGVTAKPQDVSEHAGQRMEMRVAQRTIFGMSGLTCRRSVTSPVSRIKTGGGSGLPGKTLLAAGTRFRRPLLQ